MAKQFEVKSIEYNQKMAGKYNGAFLYSVAVESGSKRKDFVFENSKQFKVLQECAVGNIVELKIVKNGDFFNLAKDDDAIVLVSKEKTAEAKVERVPHPFPSDELIEKGVIPKQSVKEYTKYKEDPDKQAAIIRQNALTNATNLIIANGVSGNVDNAIKYIIATAIQFAKFTSGEDMTEYLAEEFMDTAVVPPKESRKIKTKKQEEAEGVSQGEFGE